MVDIAAQEQLAEQPSTTCAKVQQVFTSWGSLVRDFPLKSTSQMAHHSTLKQPRPRAFFSRLQRLLGID